MLARLAVLHEDDDYRQAAVIARDSDYGEDAAAVFRRGYGAELPESRYRSWVAYHSAVMMLDAAEVREGRLGDLSYLVDELTGAVMGA